MTLTSNHAPGGRIPSDQFNEIVTKLLGVESGQTVVTYTGVAATDTANLAAALISSARVKLEKGRTYLVNAVLSVLDNTDIDLNGSTVKVADGTTPGQGVFQVINRTRVNIHDGTIDLNKANTTNPGADAGMGIYLVATDVAGITDASVRRVAVKNGHRVGIYCNATSTANPMEAVIEDCKITGCSERGIFVLRASGVRILHNRLSGNGDGGSGQIQVSSATGAGDTVIDGNRVVSGNFSGIAVSFCENVRIVNNYCANNGGTGVTSWGIVVSEDVKHFTVGNNRCLNNGSGGISVDLATAASETIKDAHGAVVGNVCSGAVDFHGIYVQYAKGVAITGNECWDNNDSGILLTNGAQNCTIAGNVCWANVLGIYIVDAGGATADCGKHAVTGNNCFANTTNYLDNATLRSKYSGNESDTSNFVASATTITIPPEHHHIKVTGSTTITSISVNAKDKAVTLIWDTGATFDVTDGSNLKLSASITTFDADDTLTLVCDGTNWLETGRSVN